LPDLGRVDDPALPRNLVLWERFPSGIYNSAVSLPPGTITGNGQYVMHYYAIGTPQHPRGMCVAFSEDGITWQPSANNPVWQTPADHVAEEEGFGTGDDVVTCGYDHVSEHYISYRRTMHDEHSVYRPGIDDQYRPNINNFLRVQARATSPDGIHWQDHKRVLAPDLHDMWDTEYYGLHAFRYADSFLGFLTVYHTDTLTVEIELRSSQDSIRWERTSAQPFIERGPAGSFDNYIAWFACPPIVMGDELLIYYGGCDYAHSLEDERWGNAGMGLARLRRDGFASLFSTKREAHVVTRPFKLKGERLLVNADARQGQLAVEVVDKDGNVIPGFERASCQVDLTSAPYYAALGQAEGGNSVRGTVSWSSDGRLEMLRGREVRFRFLLQHCHLYSFTLAE
jgi:hypothetical protein